MPRSPSHKHQSPKLVLSLFLTLWASVAMLSLTSQAYTIEVEVASPPDVIEEPLPEVTITPEVVVEVPETPVPPTPAPDISQPPVATPEPTPSPSEPIQEQPTQETSVLSLSGIVNFLKNIRENPQVRLVSERVLTPAATANAVVVTTLASLSLFNSLKDVVPVVNHIGNSVINLFAFRRRRRVTWSHIYDSSSKQPLDLAVVRLINSQTKAIVATAVSDAEGRFSMEVPAGSYILDISKPLYQYPSQFLVGLTRDGIFENLYFGQRLSGSNQKVLDLSIPLDSVSAKQTNLRFVDQLRSLFDKISTPALVVGTLVAAFILYVLPSTLNAFIVIFYLLLLLLKKVTARKTVKPWGKVIDIRSGKPISGIVVRAFDHKYNKLIDTKVTDETGSFNFLLPTGSYYLKLLSYQYRFPEAPVGREREYRGEVFSVQSGEIEKRHLYIEQHATQITYTKATHRPGELLHTETIFDYFSAKNQDATQILKKLTH